MENPDGFDAQLSILRSDINFDHTIMGIYLWEILSSVDFDVKLFYKNKSSIWVKMLYLASRYSALIAITCIVLGENSPGGFRCKPWSVVTAGAIYSAYQCSSALIALRAILIWEKDIRVITIAVAGLLALLGVNIFDMTKVSAVHDATIGACSYADSSSASINVILLFTFDTFFLLCTIVGLIRNYSTASRYSLWRFLWNQGVIWIAIATVAELPTIILTKLNINPVLSEFFFTSQIAILAAGATRMYRSLSKFLHPQKNSDTSYSMD